MNDDGQVCRRNWGSHACFWQGYTELVLTPTQTDGGKRAGKTDKVEGGSAPETARGPYRALSIFLKLQQLRVFG